MDAPAGKSRGARQTASLVIDAVLCSGTDPKETRVEVLKDNVAIEMALSGTDLVRLTLPRFWIRQRMSLMDQPQK